MKTLPDYTTLEQHIADAPSTWIPALLIAVIRAAIAKKVFKVGRVGLVNFVEKAEKRIREGH